MLACECMRVWANIYIYPTCMSEARIRFQILHLSYICAAYISNSCTTFAGSSVLLIPISTILMQYIVHTFVASCWQECPTQENTLLPPEEYQDVVSVISNRTVCCFKTCHTHPDDERGPSIPWVCRLHDSPVMRYALPMQEVHTYIYI